jgi:hypothetical protein
MVRSRRLRSVPATLQSNDARQEAGVVVMASPWLAEGSLNRNSLMERQHCGPPPQWSTSTSHAGAGSICPGLKLRRRCIPGQRTDLPALATPDARQRLRGTFQMGKALTIEALVSNGP